MTQAIPQDPPLMANGRFSTSWQRFFIGLNSGGAGSVTSVSIVPANGVSGTVGTPTTTPAITLALGNITPTQVASTGPVTGTNLSGTNTGDETTATIKTKLGIVTLSGSNTGDQTISIAGDGTAAGSTGALTLTVTKVNGVSFAGLATGILKNTTGTGVPSIAIAADFPTLNQNTSGTAANVTGVVLGANGGTGVANTGFTITLGGSLTTSGAFASTFTMTGVTTVTFPTSGTLATVNGALGTPTSVTLTNATGLPVSTGISGLAAGIAAFLGTASSANLATAVTDETGTGSLVFSTNPVFVSTIYSQQGAPASIAAAATLTAAQMLGGIIQYTGLAGALTLPTGTLMDAAVVSGLAVDRAFDVYVVNTGSGAATITAGVGFTIVGAAAVTNGTSAHWRCRKTAANTYVAYRAG